MPEIDANVDAQLHSLLEHWPDPAVVVDDKGQLVAVSQLAAQVLSLDVLPEFGRSAHATLCASARGFQHEHNQCPFHQQEAGSLLSTDWHSSYWCTQAGENISVDIRQTLLKAPFDGLAVWSFVSNEARKHNQAELQKFAALVELSPAPIAEFDTCGQLLFANNALQNVMVDVGFGDGGSGMVLGREDIATCPPHFCSELNKSFNQHRSLNRHVKTSCYSCSFQRLRRTKFFPNRHQTRHFSFC